MLNREISNFERGILVGIPIGAIAGPSIALVIFVLIVCYDLGRPKIVDIGQNLINKHLGLDLNNQTESPTEEEKAAIISLLTRAPNLSQLLGIKPD